MFFFILLIIIGVVTWLATLKEKTYGSSLEQYIVDHNPQHSGDVERLTVEYHMKNSRKEWHL